MRYFLLTLNLIFTFSIAHSQELISNGDFEGGTASWDYWENNALGFDGDFSVIADNALGSQVAQIDVNTVGDGYWTFKFFNIRLRQNGFSVDANDLLKVSFKARSFDVNNPIVRIGIAPEDQEGQNCNGITDCFWQLNMADYELVNFDITEEWTTYEAEIPVYEPTENVQLVIRVGEKPGAYYLDDISLQKIGALTFASDWYAESQARIDTLRKGDLSFTVTDSVGNRIEEAEVSVQHLKHNFEWGTAVAASTWGSTWQKDFILDLFGGIVNEDHFKWHRVEPTPGNIDYTYPDLFSNWAGENHLAMRGHTLFWPRRSNGLLPGWVNNLSGTDRLEVMEARILRDMSYFRGRMKEYDVVNEPFHNPFLHETYTDTIYHWIYSKARWIDPEAKLYVNEWGNIDLWEHVRYGNFIEKLQAMDTPLDGIGLQAHLNKPVNWKQIQYKLDYLDDFGLPLKITEFDQNVGVNGHSEEQQATDYGLAMRTFFAHPAVEGMYLWTLITGYSNTVESIFNPNGTGRVAADTMYHLIKEVWTTQEEGALSANSDFHFNGYYGDYEVTVKYKEEEFVQRINWSKSAKNQEIRLLTKVNFPPSIALSLEPNENQITAGQTLEITTTSSDPENEIAAVSLFMNGEEVNNSVSDFTHVWTSQEAGEYHFWAKVTDADQLTASSDTLRVEVIEDKILSIGSFEKDLLLFPNPTKGKIHIKNLKESLDYTTYDMTGKKWQVGSISSGKNYIEMKGLASGVYLIHLKNRLGGKVTLKLIMVNP